MPALIPLRAHLRASDLAAKADLEYTSRLSHFAFPAPFGVLEETAP